MTETATDPKQLEPIMVFYQRHTCPCCGDFRLRVKKTYRPETDGSQTKRLACLNCGRRIIGVFENSPDSGLDKHARDYN